MSNGANLNDGMDGMCAGNSAIIGVALGIFAYVSSHIQYAAYLNIMYIPGSEELVVFFMAFIGALIGFLWYNAYPAQVFMGDTGSLTIGGIIAVGAIIIHKELLLPILCGIFFVESLSVIIQVYYFKTGKLERHQATHLQAHADSRQLPHTGQSARSRLSVCCQDTALGHPRKQDYHPFLDYDHHPRGLSHHHIEDKIEIKGK